MRAKFSSRLKNPMVLLILLTLGMFVSSCRNNEVEVPPLIGDSGHHLFLTIQANPDHLVIHQPGRPRETSDITIQLKNQQGQGVPGENLKLRILNATGNEINIGRLSDYNVKTDAAGFVHVIYTAPDSSEVSGGTFGFGPFTVVISAILTNASYPREVTDSHPIELQPSAVDPGDCSTGQLVPQGPFTVSPANPVVNQTVCFTGTPTFPTAVEFFWDFDNDGQVDDAQGATVCTTFNRAGSFQITLVGRSIDRDCGTFTQVVVVEGGEAPSCQVIVSPSQVVVDQIVNFTAITDDPDGRVRSFLWNFGDGTTQRTSRNTTTHRYRTNGTFSGVLTITDDQGNVGTCTFSVTVGEEEEGDPTCSFTVSPVDIMPGTTVTVNASTSTDDGEIVNYNVDFGDGTPPVDSADPIITKPGGYALPGTYTITLIVTDDEGNTAVCSRTVTVSEEPPEETGCNDGTDNDGDGFVDFPDDPGCTSDSDPSELGATQCDNGIDDDGDGFTDFSPGPGGDPQCTSPTDTDESA